MIAAILPSSLESRVGNAEIFAPIPLFLLFLSEIISGAPLRRRRNPRFSLPQPRSYQLFAFAVICCFSLFSAL
jgi:hypothetical protein